MSLTNKKTGIYVNLVKGKFAVKDNEKQEINYFDNLTGKLVGVLIKNDNFDGQEILTSYFEITDDVETYYLKIRVQSGYFRTLCNSLRSADLSKVFTLSAAHIPQPENQKAKTVIFVKQDGKFLKHFYTGESRIKGEWVTFRGKQHYDGSKEQDFWINWLTSLKFDIQGADKIQKDLSEQETYNSDPEEQDMPF
jgi:hypothetical protein